MKYLLLIFLLLSSTNVCATELQKNHLTPEFSVFTGRIGKSTDYYPILVKNMLKGLRSLNGKTGQVELVLWTIVTPSFEPEYTIGIRKENNIYYAFKITAQTSIWYSIPEAKDDKKPVDLSKINIQLNSSQKQITEQTTNMLVVVWKEMISNTKYPKNVMGGLDGVSYHFSIDGETGRAWSPETESQTGYLVKLTGFLGHFAEAKKIEIVEKDISDTASILIDSFK